MIPCATVQRSILLAGTIAGALLTAPAFAQQPPASAPPATPPAAAQPLPPGSPLIGRPEGNAAAAKLAPIASPPLPAPADKLPTAKLKLPAGFNIEVYASGIANTRSLRVGEKGTVFVGTRFGNKVTAIVKKDGKTEIKTVAEGTLPPEWSRLSQRHALHRRAVAGFEDRQHRGCSRQAAEADRDLFRSAEG